MIVNKDYLIKDLKISFTDTQITDAYIDENLVRAENFINYDVAGLILPIDKFNALKADQKSHIKNAIGYLAEYWIRENIYSEGESTSSSLGSLNYSQTNQRSPDYVPEIVQREIELSGLFSRQTFLKNEDKSKEDDFSWEQVGDQLFLFLGNIKMISYAQAETLIKTKFADHPLSTADIKKLVDDETGKQFLKHALGLTQKVEANVAKTNQNDLEIKTNTATLAKHKGDIEANTVKTVKNKTDITKNKTDISNLKGNASGGATDWSKIDVEKNTHTYKYNEALKITVPLGCSNFTLKMCLDGTGYTGVKDDLTGSYNLIYPKELFFVFNNKEWGHVHLFEDYLSPYDIWQSYIKIDRVKKLREIYFKFQNTAWTTQTFTQILGRDPKIFILPENPFFIKDIKIEVAGNKDFVIPKEFTKMEFKKSATDVYYDEHEAKIKKINGSIGEINQSIGEISTAHTPQETRTLKAQYSQLGNIAWFQFPSIVEKFYKLVFFDSKNSEVYNLILDTFHEKIICDDKIIRDEVNFNFNKNTRAIYISWKSWEAVNWSTLKIIAFGATKSSMVSSTSGISLPFAETQTKKNSDLITSKHPAKGLILPHFPLFYIEYEFGDWKVLNKGYMKNLNWNNTTKVLTIELKSKILGGWVNLSGRFNSLDTSPEVWLMPSGQGSYKAKFYEGYDNAYSKYTYSSTNRPFIFQKYNKSAGEGIIEKCRFVLNKKDMDFSSKILDVDNDFRTSKAYGKYTGNSPFKSKTLIFKFRSTTIGASTLYAGTFFGVNLEAGQVE